MIESIASSSPSLRAAVSATAQARALTPEQQRQIQELKETDREVRAHEQAHLSVGGDLVRGGATYTYEIGPDDQHYAVGGEVLIDASPGRTPEETIPKAQRIREAALAPVDPSAQDRSVADQADVMEASARIELTAQKNDSTDESALSASAVSNQGSARFYQAVAQSDASNATVGGWLNSFA